MMLEQQKEHFRNKNQIMTPSAHAQIPQLIRLGAAPTAFSPPPPTTVKLNLLPAAGLPPINDHFSLMSNEEMRQPTSLV